MKKSALICLFLVIVSSLRAFQLYWTSTIELRTDNTHAWLLSKKLIKEDINKNKIYANNTIQVGNELENTFFFIQITDLHLSRYRGKGHTQHFLHFIQSILPVVRPEFVVVTGDLTDAKDKKRITSQQYIDEWTVYQTAIKEKVSLDWYDMRGNHDCFNLPSWKSRVNYFRTHGNSADMVEQGKGIYTWQIKQPYSEYQFIAMDACPKRGPSRPLNFFGYLTSRTMDRLETALTSKTYNHTFVFSHYPTTSMVFGISNNGVSFRNLARHYSVYFCGHLHKLIAGLGDVLQSYDPVTKSLELELGDMKEHGLYRIFAVDHDLLSFVDIELPLKQITAEKLDASGLIYPMKNDSIVWPEPLNLSPAILVTNPKDSRYSIPSKEPLWRTKESTHIRFFVFSQHAPEDLQVTLWIDGAIHLEKATFIGTTQKPMWTSPWDPTLYDDRKKHQLVVEVITPDEKKSTSSIPFRIDTQRIKMGGGSGEFIIKSHMTTVLQIITLSSIISMFCLLLIPKFYKHASRQNAVNTLLLRIHAIDQAEEIKSKRSWLRKQILVWAVRFLQLPDEQPVVWYATLFYVCALLSLPWFRAEFIPSGETFHDRYGLFYMWGMMFGNEWIPIADTWLFAAEEVVADVLVFLILSAKRGIHTEQLSCSGVAEKTSYRKSKSAEEKKIKGDPISKSVEVIYWLWRMSEVIALASFYGGIWPTLVQNIVVYWMIFVGIVMGWGKNGLFTNKTKRRRPITVEGCSSCQDPYYEQDEKHSVSPIQYDSSTTLNEVTLTQEEEQRVNGHSSSSSTFDININVKTRKRGMKI